MFLKYIYIVASTCTSLRTRLTMITYSNIRSNCYTKLYRQSSTVMFQEMRYDYCVYNSYYLVLCLYRSKFVSLEWDIIVFVLGYRKLFTMKRISFQSDPDPTFPATSFPYLLCIIYIIRLIRDPQIDLWCLNLIVNYIGPTYCVLWYTNGYYQRRCY